MKYFILRRITPGYFYDRSRYAWLEEHYETAQEAFGVLEKRGWEIGTKELEIVEITERVVPIFESEELVTPPPYKKKVRFIRE